MRTWRRSDRRVRAFSGPGPSRRSGARRLSGLLRLHLQDRRQLAEREEFVRGARREQMHAAGDHSSPARLMARANAGAVVAVEVLVEEDEIPPVRVLLELPAASVHGPAAGLVPPPDPGGPPVHVLSDLLPRHPVIT